MRFILVYGNPHPAVRHLQEAGQLRQYIHLPPQTAVFFSSSSSSFFSFLIKDCMERLVFLAPFVFFALNKEKNSSRLSP